MVSAFRQKLSCGCLALAAMLLAVPVARAEDSIWTALILATNGKKSDSAPRDLALIRDQVEEVFGYDHVELVGAAIKTVDDEFARWLVPSQHFWLSVKTKGVDDNSRYPLQLEMWHDRRMLFESAVVLGPESPLFIRGPLHAKGQLIIVLKVLPGKDRLPTKPPGGSTVVKSATEAKGKAVQVKGQ